MNRNNKKLTALLAIGAVGAYRFYKGKGGFNKIRFKTQHEAVSKYVETHYPGAFYSDIVKTSKGWTCAITARNTRIALYINKAPDNTFIFWEEKM